MASITRRLFELPPAAKDDEGLPARFYIEGNAVAGVTESDDKAFVTLIEHESPNVKNRIHGSWFIIVRDGEEYTEHQTKRDPEYTHTFFFTEYFGTFTLNGSVYHLVRAKR